MKYITIDGAQGEGGGQVLRTALTLSILTKQPIELVNIRANRAKPGLLRQHYISVMAAKTVSNAEVEGVELGATSIRFSPGELTGGDYHFSIGTAGSTVLVCQTILPVLALANTASTVTFEGGTHNGMSPSLCFLQHSYLPLLRKMGVACRVSIEKLGFYPAGGGKWQMLVEPTARLQPLDGLEACAAAPVVEQQCQLKALISSLPKHIGDREVATAAKVLAWQQAPQDVELVESAGPGNSFQAMVSTHSHASVFETVGELGVSAERVAKRCAGRVKQFLNAQATVEEHLADQLLVPMALAGSGSFTTTKPSLHTLTNIDVIKRFLPVRVSIEQQTKQRWSIDLTTT